jgi:16S rRNA processing protein RimM
LEGELLGRLVDVLPAGGNDIFVIQGGKREILIPALAAVVKKIDLAEHRIEVSLPTGLREIYEA